MSRALRRAAKSVFGLKAFTTKLETAGGFGPNAVNLIGYNSVRAPFFVAEHVIISPRSRYLQKNPLRACRAKSSAQ